MKAYNVNLTEQEVAIVKHALEIHNDITNDTLFENFAVDLFPSPGEVRQIGYENAQVLRKDINDAVNKMITLRALTNKFNIKLHDNGYSK